MSDTAKSTLEKFAVTVIFFGALGGIYFYTRPVPSCTEPITYDIGTVDPRFGESRTDLIAATKEATALWNTAAGKSLFTYEPGAALKVNLIYDTRQQTTDLGKEIAGEQAANETEKEALDARQKAYAQEQAQFEAKVSYWNAHGGAPKNVYDQLQAEQQSLNAQWTVLNQDVQALNEKIAATNAKAQTFNASAGSDFNEGEYIRDESGERINVYDFATHLQLMRVLAHEFGHALGLEHNTDPNAIMYAYNQGTAGALTAADIQELNALCNSH